MCANFGYLSLFLMQKYLEMSILSGRNSSAKKMITDVTIDPGCEVNCNRSLGNCNILQNNVIISTVI